MQPPRKREACSVTLRAADLNYAMDDRSQPASMGISTLVETISCAYYNVVYACSAGTCATALCPRYKITSPLARGIFDHLSRFNSHF